MLWVYDAAFELSRIGGGSEYAIVEVQLIASRNLIQWQRVGNRQPVIARGAPGTFDSHMIFYHSRPLVVGDEWWVYYVGFNEGHAAKALYDEALREQYWAEIRAGRRHFPAIGLAKVRRDGVCLARRRGGRRHADDAADAAGRGPAGGERDGGPRWGADGGGAG